MVNSKGVILPAGAEEPSHILSMTTTAFSKNPTELLIQPYHGVS